MSKKKPVKNQKKVKEIRKKVKARVEQEAQAYPAAAVEDGKMTDTLVRWCMNAQELGMGHLYASLLRGTIVFNNGLQEWLFWTGHHWSRDVMERHQAAVENVVDRILEAIPETSEQISWALKKKDDGQVKQLQAYQEQLYKKIYWLRTEKGRNTTIKLARTCRDPLAIEGLEIDMIPWLLPCKNGVVDLRTGIFRDGRPEDYLFKASPTEWKGLDEPAERWERFLIEVQDGKQEVVDYIHRLLGYSISAFNTEHIFPIFYGPNGRNGKGVIAEVLNYVLGNICGAIQPEIFLGSKNPRSSAAPSPDIIDLQGLRICFASETDEGSKFSASRVKLLTGGDQLVGRSPHGRYLIRFKPTHTIFLLTNRRPEAQGDDAAFWERIHVVPFRLSFVARDPVESYERKRDKDLARKLEAEASGILAWLVRGYMEYSKKGLDPPVEVLKETAGYRQAEDVIAQWIEARCDLGENYYAQAKDLYDDFKGWFEENLGDHPIGSKRFYQSLHRRFRKALKNSLQHYFGICLKGNRS